MVLDYFGYYPLPNQTQLAFEMNTDINSTTQWRYASIPFEKRGFRRFLNQSLSSDFNVAFCLLKEELCQNYPAIVSTWYDEQAKDEGKVTHARVISGYNSTGIFFHDPWSGPSQFMENPVFADMWKTDLGYWAFIVEEKPWFELTVQVTDWFGNPIPHVSLVLQGPVKDTMSTDLSGTAKFNLTMADYALAYDWRFQSEKINITLTKSESIKFRPFLSDQVIFGTAMLGTIIVAIVVVASIVATKKRRTK
jgi:hypothetical protein